MSCHSILVVLVSVALAAPASADSDTGSDAPFTGDIEEFSMEELLRKPVASATGGIEVESDVVPANVTTISRDDISAFGWQSVGEVLQHVAGLYVIDDHVMPAVAVRGISGGLRSGSRIVKVMINGTEVTFRPDLTAMLGPEYLPLIAVERIEIARGPLSALYGANAFLATVNVVTRTASQARSEVALSTERHEGDRGSGVGAGGSALISTGEGKHGVVLAARFDRLNRSGLVIRRTFPGQATPDQQEVFDRPSDFDLSRPFGLYGQAKSQGGWGEIALQGGFQRLDAYGEFQPDSALTHRSRHGLQNAWSSLSHTRTWIPRLTSTVTVGASRGSPISEEALVLGSNRNSIYQPQLSYAAFDGKATVLFQAFEKLQALFALEATHEQHRGFTYRQTFVRPEASHAVGEQIDARPPIEVSMSNFAPALQLLSEPVPDLHVFANGRLDLSDVFDAQYSWRIGTAYRLSPTLVAKLIAGRAFQSPSPVLLYGLPGFGVAGTSSAAKPWARSRCSRRSCRARSWCCRPCPAPTSP
jgi:outer membrane receptor protein involved in Fe transport